MTVSDTDLARIMPNLGAAKREQYLPLLVDACAEFKIDTRLRLAAFLAQIAHESGEFRYLEEIASGASYEGRRDLGNTQPGDGKRFKGRGVIQVTGRANYRHYGELLGLKLEENPALAADPKVAFRVAGAYWHEHGCNLLADDGHFEAITRKINGGLNGQADRVRYYERALEVLKEEKAPAPVILAGYRLPTKDYTHVDGRLFFAARALEDAEVGAVLWDEHAGATEIRILQRKA